MATMAIMNPTASEKKARISVDDEAGAATSLQSRSYRRTLQAQQRTIGYTFCPAKDPQHSASAILYFYPLSGASVVVEHASSSFEHYKSSVLSVDRPGVGSSDYLANQQSSIDRIQRYAEDVLNVLRHHDEIKHVYLLGVCLGHPYAVQVARRLLQEQQNESSSLPSVQGLTLVAPYVSTACPTAWKIARLGASVPYFLLSTATYSLTSLAAWVTPYLLTPERVQNELIDEEQQRAFGWKGDDFETVRHIIMEISDLNPASTRATEANLGADPSWQQIIDNFSVESGCGLVHDDKETDDDHSADSLTERRQGKSACAFPIRIRATEYDGLATFESVQWVGRRNYGMINEEAEEKMMELESWRIHSHEGMTLLGGPPRNPVLLHEIAQEWSLLDAKNLPSTWS